MPIDAIGMGGLTAGGRSTLVSNFETFLQLLTTQLKNQDPLSPLDSNDFTAQLTQMAGVEQQLLTNDLLQALVAQGGMGGLDSAVHYVGREVVAAGSASRLDEGSATWSYELATNAGSATLEVLDSTGAVVWSGEAPELGSGVHDFTWDGRTSDGTQLADGGVYSLRVRATTAGGQAVDSQVLIRGVVTAVELYDGVPYVTVGGSILPLSQVISVSAVGARPPAETDGDGGALSGLMSGAMDLLNPIDELAAVARAVNPLKLL